jgi:hypothetical protein
MPPDLLPSSSAHLDSPGSERRKVSAISANPPRLESVLTRLGSNRAFAIFVQEQCNAAAPADDGCSNPDGPTPELHNNGVPSMKVGCGRAGCVDVEFYLEAWTWEQEGKHAYAGLAQQQQQKAKEIYGKYIANPVAPLHIPIAQEQRDSLSAAIAEAASNSTLLPPSLFHPLAHAVYAYLDSTFFSLFLNTLAFDHLEVESLLLGGGVDTRKFMKSAHGVYKEEYVMFYLDYENVRQIIEAGPPAPDAPATHALSSASNLGSSRSSLDGSKNSATSSDRLSTSPPSWFELVITKLDSMYRTYFRSKAEYAIYIEPDVRAALNDYLKVSKKSGSVDLNLLNTLLTIKDYCVEVIKYDILPAYKSDLITGHRRQRRASLIAATLPPVESMPLPVLQAPIHTHTSSDVAPPPGLNGGESSRRSSIVRAAVDVPLGVRRVSASVGKHGRQANPLSYQHSTPDDTPNSSAASSPAIAPLPADIDGPMHPSSLMATSPDDDSPSRGPLPSSNPNLRSFSDLRARRSIVGGTINLPPSAIPTGQPPPPDHEPSDEEDEVDTAQSAMPNPMQFLRFQATAEDLLKPNTHAASASSNGSPSASPSPSPPSSSSSSTLAPLPFTALRRRSVLGSASSASPIHSVAFEDQKELTWDLGFQPEFAAKEAVQGATAPTSILKSRIRHETLSELLRRIFLERIAESDLHLPILKQGCLILKYNAAGKAAERWFKVSEDGTELCWGKVDEKTKVPLKSGLFNRKKRFPLADVTRIRYGSSNSKRFSKYNLSAKSMPWMAFSIYFPEKTLDLVCRSEKDINTWFQGVQALSPLSTGYLSRGGVIWRRTQMKIKWYAMWQNIAPEMVRRETAGGREHAL